jgi:hypothetical protein
MGSCEGGNASAGGEDQLSDYQLPASLEGLCFMELVYEDYCCLCIL